MSQPTQEDLAELVSYVDGLYEELDKLSKRGATDRLSDFAAARVNRAIADGKALLGPHDKYAGEFAQFVAAGENPETRDALLAVREVKQAALRVIDKLGYWQMMRMKGQI